MSDAHPAKQAADSEKLKGDTAHQNSDFDTAIAHYEAAWALFPDLGYANLEATSRYQKSDCLGVIAALQNGLDNGAPETLTPSARAEAYVRIGQCHVALGDRSKGVEFAEKALGVHSSPPSLTKLEKSWKETEKYGDRDLADKIATTVLNTFAKLPKKRKPLEGGGRKEWVPLSGIVAQIDDDFQCIALGTGMKCLPHAKLQSAEGKVLHDWHAEVVALRSLNAFFLEEINKLRGVGRFAQSQKQESAFLRPLTREERGQGGGEEYTYTIKSEVKLHMYCSEAPCGDASMELTMAAQEDATPWEVVPTDAGALPGRAGFGQLGIVRRKPSRPDAPECRSKSCSDKLAQKQMTSVLNSLTSLAISPSNAYLSTFTIPESQYVPAAILRSFGEVGRLGGIREVMNLEGGAGGGYRFQPFRTITTEKEFGYSRRSTGLDGGRARPSNIACSWSPWHEETIIGGVLQGCKLTIPPKDEAVSVLSRFRMWQALEVDGHTEDSVAENGGFARSYGELKEGKGLCARRVAKEGVRGVLMGGREWVANSGDEDWGRESGRDLAKKMIKEVGYEATCDGSDAVSENAADLAVARDQGRERQAID